MADGKYWYTFSYSKVAGHTEYFYFYLAVICLQVGSPRFTEVEVAVEVFPTWQKRWKVTDWAKRRAWKEDIHCSAATEAWPNDASLIDFWQSSSPGCRLALSNINGRSLAIAFHAARLVMQSTY